MSIFSEDLGSSMPSLPLTLNVEPLLKIPLGGEPVNGYEFLNDEDMKIGPCVSSEM